MTHDELRNHLDNFINQIEAIDKTRCKYCGAPLTDIQNVCPCGVPVTKVIQPNQPLNIEAKLSFLYQEMVSLADSNRAMNDSAKALECLVAAADVLDRISSLRGL